MVEGRAEVKAEVRGEMQAEVREEVQAEVRAAYDNPIHINIIKGCHHLIFCHNRLKIGYYHPITNCKNFPFIHP